MDLRKNFSILSFLILSVISCENIHLIQPYNLNGNVTVFFDGEMVGTYNEYRIDGTSVSSESDINISVGYSDEINPDLYDELIVYHRKLDWSEVLYLYRDPGNLPVDTSDLAGYYQFEGNVNCDASASGPDGVVSESTVILNYQAGGLDGSALNISGSDGNLLFDSTILPDIITEMTVSVWIKSEDLHASEFMSILNCWGGDDHDDFFNIDINWDTISNTTHKLDEYDKDLWHMITILVEEY